MGAFATTLLTVLLAMMGFRGVSTQSVFVGNLCLVAGVGMVVSAQWAMAKGDTFTYTALTAFGAYRSMRYVVETSRSRDSRAMFLQDYSTALMALFTFLP